MMQLNTNIFTSFTFRIVSNQNCTSENYCFTKVGWKNVGKLSNGKASFTLGLLIFFALLCSLHANSEEPKCYSCQDHYMTSADLCPKSKENCGQCMEGFAQHKDGSCRYQYKVNHNQNASIPIGHSAILNCKFDKLVDCAWFKDMPLFIIGRYSFVHGNGDNTVDCSLTISEITNNDYGKWVCASKTDSYSEGVIQSRVWISPTNDIKDGLLTPRISNEAISEARIKRSSDDYTQNTNYWCYVNNLIPVQLQWLIEGKPIQATAEFRKPVSNIEIAIPMDSTKMGYVLTCIATYPDLGLTFLTSIEIELKEGSALDQQTTVDVSFISVVTVVIIISITFIIAVTLLIIYRCKKTKAQTGTPRNGQGSAAEELLEKGKK